MWRHFLNIPCVQYPAAARQHHRAVQCFQQYAQLLEEEAWMWITINWWRLKFSFKTIIPHASRAAALPMCFLSFYLFVLSDSLECTHHLCSDVTTCVKYSNQIPVLWLRICWAIVQPRICANPSLTTALGKSYILLSSGWATSMLLYIYGLYFHSD